MMIRLVLAAMMLIAVIADCTRFTPATVFSQGQTEIKVELPAGTRVSILDDTPSKPTVKIRIEEGEFKGQEATAPRMIFGQHHRAPSE
jgi:hypothetical protein